MTTRKEWYERVNSTWPAEVPVLTADEAERATRKLYRFVIGRKLDIPIEITSGNRYTYARGGLNRRLYVNPGATRHGGGWKALVHDLSHWLHRKVNYEDAPHDKSHARLELKLTKEVVKRGWLNGTLKTVAKEAPPPQDTKLQQLLRTESAIQRWEIKLRRAQNALKKLGS